MSLDVDLEREQDIEELRRIAQALKAQNALLLEALTKKSRELERLRGKPGDLQLTLKMIEMLQAKTKAAEDALARAEAEQKKRAAERAEKERAPRTKTGPTPQPLLPVVPQVFTLDDADRACPSCGGELRGPAEPSACSRTRRLSTCEKATTASTGWCRPGCDETR